MLNSPMTLEGKSITGFISYLTEEKFLTDTAARLLRDTLDREKTGLCATILGLGLLPEEILADTLSTYLNIKTLDHADIHLQALPPVHLNRRFLRQYSILPVARTEAGLHLAMLDPLDNTALKMVATSLQDTIIPLVATRSQLDSLFDHFLPDGQEEVTQASANLTVAASKWADRARGASEDTPAVRLIDRLIDKAVQARASDIHIDLSAGLLNVRYRIDGILEQQLLPHIDDPQAVISRIKVMAEMDIAEKRLPQDGRARIVSGGREIDLRLASLPVLEGESITIRLLNKSQAPLNLSDLGYSPHNLKLFRQLLDCPNGLILVTGPTGSGKTTSLYAALQEKIDGRTKIMSIEDPVEFNLSGVTQISVNSSIGLTFPSVLRATLRHDPDIILVGEIRDRETAEIAVRAALTGHLVLATLHTNTAIDAISRLLDMGIPDYLITASVRGTIAQRLVRRCATPAQPALGYSGRSAISEVLLIDADIRKLILAGADTAEIEAAAHKAGMQTIMEDAHQKIAAGTTTEEEVFRVSYGITSTEKYA